MASPVRIVFIDRSSQSRLKRYPASAHSCSLAFMDFLAKLQSRTLSQPHRPIVVVDQEIEDEVDVLRKARFFVEFDQIRSSLTLGGRIIEADLSGGTAAVRCRALAWCARLLSHTDELGKAEQFLQQAKLLGTCQEIDIADAFIASGKSNKGVALEALAAIDSSASRSAALIIVQHHEGAEGVIPWLKNAAIDAVELDPDGKSALLTSQLERDQWDTATNILLAVTEQDSKEAPVLHRVLCQNSALLK